MEMRKLKRGLRDISSLFELPAEPILPPSSAEIHQRSLEVVNVFSADHPEDSLFYNTYLASRISNASFPSSVISLESYYRPGKENSGKSEGPARPLSHHLRHFSLSWEQFEKITASPIHCGGVRHSESQSIFIDFDYAKVPYPEKVIAILDKWVLAIKPTLESLTETYKMIKAARPINPHLEYFIFLDGDLKESDSSLLFEQFSEIVAKHLGIHLGWLGGVNLSHHALPSHDLGRFDHLFLDSPATNHSPAKISLAQFVQSFSDSVARHVI